MVGVFTFEIGQFDVAPSHAIVDVWFRRRPIDAACPIVAASFRSRSTLPATRCSLPHDANQRLELTPST